MFVICGPIERQERLTSLSPMGGRGGGCFLPLPIVVCYLASIDSHFIWTSSYTWERLRDKRLVWAAEEIKFLKKRMFQVS